RAVASLRRGTGADQGRGPGLQIAHVDIADVLAGGCYAGHQVVGEAVEGNVATVGTDDRILGVIVAAAGAGGANTHQRCMPGAAVVQEDVAAVVGVVGDDVV